MTDKLSKIKDRIEDMRIGNLIHYCNNLARIPEYGGETASDEYFASISILKDREAVLRGE
jgi:hypothetical protein